MTSASDQVPGPTPSSVSERGTAVLPETEAPDDAEPVVDDRRPIALPGSSAGLLVLFVAFGLCLLLFTSLTVHRRSLNELVADPMTARAHFAIAHWVENGYLASGGLLHMTWVNDPLYIYRSSTGGYMVPGFIVEKVYETVTGRTSLRLLAWYNQILSMFVASVMALLGFRLAMRCGAAPLHAAILAFSLQAVLFTFPDNLARYWGVTGREYWLLFAAVFLLIEDQSREERTRLMMLLQAISAFLLMYMEYVAGIFFLTSFSIASLVLGGGRSTLRRLAVTCGLPVVLALNVFALQLVYVNVQFPEIPKIGSGFLSRTGLDGSSTYYTGHLDIAFGRDLARRNFPANREALFHWPGLFLAGTIALISVLMAASRSRVPREATLALVSLLGAYILYGAVFSQAVVIHPYLYDVMLFTPLVLALFVVAPSLLERATGRTGVVALAVLFVAIWVSMVQLRNYMLMYPSGSAAPALDAPVARDQAPPAGFEAEHATS